MDLTSGQSDIFFRKMEKILTDASWVVCILLTLTLVVDISLRFLLSRPLPAAWEICELLMPFIVFLPLAYTSTINGHVYMSLLLIRVPPKVQLGFNLVANSVCFAMTALLTYWSFLQFWESFLLREEMMAMIKLPWWLGKMAMPVGIGVFTFRYFIKILLVLFPARHSGV